MAICESVILGNTWRLTFAPETTCGTDPTATTGLKTIFGVVQSATMPDNDIEWQPVWALGDASKRNFYYNYKGKITLNGSISDIWALNGACLYQGLGTVATTGTDSGTGGSTLNGATVAGATTIVLNSGTGYADNDYIQVDTTTKAEVRKISSGGGTVNLTLNFPLQFAHDNGATCNEVTYPYTHTISNTAALPTITMQHEMFNSAGTSKLIRRWSGGKVGRISYSANEGEELRVSLDDIIFLNYKTDDTGATTATPTYPTTLPYIFSYASLTFWGTEFARIKSFNLDVSNNNEPKYYLTTGATAYLPYEVKEGRREIKLGVKVDITDSTFFDEMVKYGINHGSTVDGLFKGFDTTIVFTRGASDTITFTMPESAATASGDGQGCFIKSAPHNIVTDSQVAVDLDILVRSLKITVVDSNPMVWSA